MSLKDSYWGHTPIFWKKVGESVRALGAGFTVSAITADNHTWAIALVIITWVGNTIINFASDDKPAQP